MAYQQQSAHKKHNEVEQHPYALHMSFVKEQGHQDSQHHYGPSGLEPLINPRQGLCTTPIHPHVGTCRIAGNDACHQHHGNGQERVIVEMGIAIHRLSPPPRPPPVSAAS